MEKGAKCETTTYKTREEMGRKTQSVGKCLLALVFFPSQIWLPERLVLLQYYYYYCVPFCIMPRLSKGGVNPDQKVENWSLSAFPAPPLLAYRRSLCLIMREERPVCPLMMMEGRKRRRRRRRSRWWRPNEVNRRETG